MIKELQQKFPSASMDDNFVVIDLHSKLCKSKHNIIKKIYSEINENEDQENHSFEELKKTLINVLLI